MGVQLNIKDETVARLARELAEAEGKTVTQALRDLLERESREREAQRTERLQGIRALLDGVQHLWHPETRKMTSKELMDSIYDEDGLPK